MLLLQYLPPAETGEEFAAKASAVAVSGGSAAGNGAAVPLQGAGIRTRMVPARGARTVRNPPVSASGCCQLVCLRGARAPGRLQGVCRQRHREGVRYIPGMNEYPPGTPNGPNRSRDISSADAGG